MIAAGGQSALEGQVKALHPEAPVFFSVMFPKGSGNIRRVNPGLCPG